MNQTHIIILVHDTNPFADPAIQAAAICFLLFFLGFLVSMLFFLKNWVGRT